MKNMKRLALSIVTASVVLTGVGMASAQTTITTTTSSSSWTTDQGAVIREYSTNKQYTPFVDPSLQPNIGMVLPGTVTLYALPETISIPEPDRYSYSIVNNHPVIVERSSRRIIHTWE
jgi:hypothetical protein